MEDVAAESNNITSASALVLVALGGALEKWAEKNEKSKGDKEPHRPVHNCVSSRDKDCWERPCKQTRAVLGRDERKSANNLPTRHLACVRGSSTSRGKARGALEHVGCRGHERERDGERSKRAHARAHLGVGGLGLLSGARALAGRGFFLFLIRVEAIRIVETCGLSSGSLLRGYDGLAVVKVLAPSVELRLSAHDCTPGFELGHLALQHGSAALQKLNVHPGTDEDGRFGTGVGAGHLAETVDGAIGSAHVGPLLVFVRGAIEDAKGGHRVTEISLGLLHLLSVTALRLVVLANVGGRRGSGRLVDGRVGSTATGRGKGETK